VTGAREAVVQRRWRSDGHRWVTVTLPRRQALTRRGSRGGAARFPSDVHGRSTQLANGRAQLEPGETLIAKEEARRVTEAMFTMAKFDIAALEKVYAGG
jgi:hypothetical protein